MPALRKVLTVLALLLVLVPAVSVQATNGAAPRTFLDTVRATAFSLSSDPATPDYGRFTFAVAGVGSYVGRVPDAIRKKGGDGTILNFKGEVVFLPEAETSGAAGPRQVIVNAQVGPQIGQATAVLKEVGGASFQLVSANPGQGSAGRAVAAVALALQQEDWAALYRLTASALTEGKSVEEFAAEMALQTQSVGRVVEVQLLSQPTVAFSPHGIWYFTVRSRVSFLREDVRSTEEFTDYYLLDGGDWHFWFSAPD